MVIYFISFLVSAAGAWMILRYGDRMGLSDCPTTRSSHCIPTPKGGGVGILFVFVIVAVGGNISCLFWMPILAAGLLGLWDDRVHLPPGFRLTIQIIAATFTSCTFSFWEGSFFSTWMMMLFAVLFIVSTANFYNFMDGIDGLAGMTGVIGFSLVAIFADYSAAGDMAAYITMAICMSAACLGFLLFNWPIAKVFMGDVGSILLGFVFAGTVLVLSNDFLDLICLAACIFPFYADCAITLVIRILDGEKLSQPHRRHLYQLLVNELQIEHWKVTLIYVSFQIITACCVMFLKPDGYFAVGGALLLILCLFSSASLMLRKFYFRVQGLE